MRDDHHDGKHGDAADRQPDEARQDDHRPTDSPENAANQKVEIKVKLPAKATDDDQFEKDNPKSARKQKPGQFAPAFASKRREERACPGQKNETGRAKMRDPARQEQRHVGLVEIERIERYVG